MKKIFSYLLFFLIVFLLGFSFLFFACLSTSFSLERFGNTTYYLFRQLRTGLLVGIIFGFIAYKFPLKLLKKIALPLVLLNIILLFCVFIPGIGLKVNGAHRWINIFGFTFQPSELLKITSILYLSAWIASKLSEKSVSDWKAIAKKGWHNILYILIPFLVFLGVIAFALHLQKDLSTLGIISLTLLVIYFSSKTPVWHTIAMVITGIGIAAFMIIFEPYRFQRFLTFLNPNADPLNTGFQIKQSLISLGSGGIFGNGLGMSSQKFKFLPEAMTDSIFAIMGEEIGLLGCIILIISFIIFFWLGIKIFKNSNDMFSKLTAIGIVFWITFQAFLNILAAIGWFPIAGIPLPFFSYGGSHLMVELIAVGLLLNISKNT